MGEDGFEKVYICNLNELHIFTAIANLKRNKKLPYYATVSLMLITLLLIKILFFFIKIVIINMRQLNL